MGACAWPGGPGKTDYLSPAATSTSFFRCRLVRMGPTRYALETVEGDVRKRVHAEDLNY
jgi:hypothetical protein